MAPGTDRLSHIALLVLGLTVAVPLAAGISGTVLPAIGWFPALGARSFSTDPWLTFLATPGLMRAVLLSLTTGLIASFLSFIASFALIVALSARTPAHLLRAIMGPLIAVPHSTMAIGILFLLAPSGWLMRILSPDLTGFLRPPVTGILPDLEFYGLIVALMAKEIPFLFLVSMAVLATRPAAQLANIGRSLGYRHGTAMWLLVMPAIYRGIRLPLAAVLVFSVSVVDMPLVLGPGLPPPLAVLVVYGFEDPDLLARLPAAAGAMLQAGLALAALVIWRIGEIVTSQMLRRWRRRGWRRFLPPVAGHILTGMAGLPVIAGILGLVAACLWSVTTSWFFPDALPAMISFEPLLRVRSLMPALAATLIAGGIGSILATAVSLLVLQSGLVTRIGPALHWMICIPLLLPQISIVTGLQMMMLWTRLDGSWLAMIWMHMLFILPYAWLVMAPAYAALDPRYDRVAASLGKGGWHRFRSITLPLLAPALTTVLFLGMSVSVALYLPSLFAGGGRITTITVEAVALAAGGSRQMAGLAAMVQLVIPLITFICLQGWFRWRYEKFAGMRGGRLH
ncbi:MAG: ABC transporter permease [Pseudomonadota bacterium]|nr:ABC transporter permease [Pseudomonadota bacterium]